MHSFACCVPCGYCFIFAVIVIVRKVDDNTETKKLQTKTEEVDNDLDIDSRSQKINSKYSFFTSRIEKFESFYKKKLDFRCNGNLLMHIMYGMHACMCILFVMKTTVKRKRKTNMADFFHNLRSVLPTSVRLNLYFYLF